MKTLKGFILKQPDLSLINQMFFSVILHMLECWHVRRYNTFVMKANSKNHNRLEERKIRHFVFTRLHQDKWRLC